MRKARVDPGTLMVPARATSLSPSEKPALTFHTGDLWIILPEEVNAEQAFVSEQTVKHHLKKPEPEPPLRQVVLFSRLILGEARAELDDLWAQSPSGFVCFECFPSWLILN